MEISAGGMVWSARELFYGVVTLIELGYDPPTGFGILGLVSIALVAAEIWGEFPPHSESWAIFDGWGTGS